MAKAPKLTKKQKKALAFRERKAKNKVKALDGFEDNDIPVEENQDAVEAEVPSGHVEDQARRQELEASAGEEDNRVVESSHSLKKRKRREEEAGKGVEDEPKAKKRKAADSNEHEDPSISRSSIPKAVAESNVKEKRFILFIGNLKYTTTQKAIQIHFAACDPPPTVRLITPKAPSSGKPVTKSKGCAFLEFSSRNALQQALKLHQSELEGRMINVELTAGGGGKSESRLEKLKQRNKELHEQRRKRLEKQNRQGKIQGPEDEGGSNGDILRSQRYSATSGLDQAPIKRRTWTVGDLNEGQSRQSKKNKKRTPRALGTGVNAIPVG